MPSVTSPLPVCIDSSNGVGLHLHEHDPFCIISQDKGHKILNTDRISLKNADSAESAEEVLKKVFPGVVSIKYQ